MEPFEGTLMEPFEGTLMEPFEGTLMEPFEGTPMEPFEGSLMEPFEGTRVEPFQGTLILYRNPKIPAPDLLEEVTAAVCHCQARGGARIGFSQGCLRLGKFPVFHERFRG